MAKLFVLHTFYDHLFFLATAIKTYTVQDGKTVCLAYINILRVSRTPCHPLRDKINIFLPTESDKGLSFETNH